jgi:hypothetical protein
MQQRDPAVHQQANQTGGVQLIRRQLHLSPQRYHQGRCRQGMAEQIFHVPLAPHQSIERMGIALNRGEDRFDHRGDDFGLDCLAQPGLDKGAGNDFAAHIGNLFGAAKFTRHARGKRACGRALRRLLFVQQHLAAAARGGNRAGRDDFAIGHIAPFFGVDDDGGHIAGAQTAQALFIIQQKPAAPEGVAEPVALQFMDEHAELCLMGIDPLEHGSWWDLV